MKFKLDDKLVGQRRSRKRSGETTIRVNGFCEGVGSPRVWTYDERTEIGGGWRGDRPESTRDDGEATGGVK